MLGLGLGSGLFVAVRISDSSDQMTLWSGPVTSKPWTQDTAAESTCRTMRVRRAAKTYSR